MQSSTFNLIGLLLDIVGVIIVWRFGLPPSIDRTGAIHIVVSGSDEGEKKKGWLYDCLSRIGLVLLIAGFGFQIVATLLSRAAT